MHVYIQNTLNRMLHQIRVETCFPVHTSFLVLAPGTAQCALAPGNIMPSGSATWVRLRPCAIPVQCRYRPGSRGPLWLMFIVCSAMQDKWCIYPHSQSCCLHVKLSLISQSSAYCRATKGIILMYWCPKFSCQEFASLVSHLSGNWCPLADSCTYHQRLSSRKN